MIDPYYAAGTMKTDDRPVNLNRNASLMQFQCPIRTNDFIARDPDGFSDRWEMKC